MYGGISVTGADNADVMSVISHQSSASDTYHEVKDLLKGIFKVPTDLPVAPTRDEVRASVQQLTPGGKGGDKVSNLGSIMNDISRVELSTSPLQVSPPRSLPRTEHVSPRKPSTLDQMLAA